MAKRKDDTFYVSLHKTTSQHYVVIHLASATTQRSAITTRNRADAEPFHFTAPQKTSEYSLDHYQHKFYLRSNRNGKTLGCTVPARAMKTPREELIPPREHIMPEGFTPVYRLLV